MAEWSSSTITIAGHKMLIDTINGSGLTITKALGGSAVYPPASLAMQTDITAPKIPLSIVSFDDFDKGKAVKIRLQNEKLSKGYTLRQIGLYLSNGVDECLLSISQDEIGEYIPSEFETPKFMLEFELALKIGECSNLIIEINRLEYVTFEDLTASLQHRPQIFINETEPVTDENEYLWLQIKPRRKQTLKILPETEPYNPDKDCHLNVNGSIATLTNAVINGEQQDGKIRIMIT